MYTKLASVVNATELHARPVSDFVREAATYKSDITIQREGEDEQAAARGIHIVLASGRPLALMRETAVV